MDNMDVTAVWLRGRFTVHVRGKIAPNATAKLVKVDKSTSPFPDYSGVILRLETKPPTDGRLTLKTQQVHLTHKEPVPHHERYGYRHLVILDGHNNVLFNGQVEMAPI